MRRRPRRLPLWPEGALARKRSPFSKPPRASRHRPWSTTSSSMNTSRLRIARIRAWPDASLPTPRAPSRISADLARSSMRRLFSSADVGLGRQKLDSAEHASPESPSAASAHATSASLERPARPSEQAKRKTATLASIASSPDDRRPSSARGVTSPRSQATRHAHRIALECRQRLKAAPQLRTPATMTEPITV